VVHGLRCCRSDRLGTAAPCINAGGGRAGRYREACARCWRTNLSGLGEVETALSQADLASNNSDKALGKLLRNTNRGSLPAYLQRIEKAGDFEESDGLRVCRIHPAGAALPG